MRRVIGIALGAALFALAATAGSAKADLLPGLLGGGCGATTNVFAHWNDSAGYYFASNGGFESGTTNWSLAGGASLVADNDAYRLSGAGSHALRLPAGATAAINVCYGLTYPAVRFTVSGSGRVHVRVVARSLLGVLSILDGGSFSVNSSWDASPKLSTLFSALAAPLGTKSMQLQITADSGTVSIDDLYVDPFLTRQ
jgi:hypothetical protein